MLSKVDIDDYKSDGYVQPAPKVLKYDGGKPKLDLLDWDALNGLASVLTFGAQKYEPNLWRDGIANSRLIASLLRHLSSIQRGEDIDAESGLPHIDHLGCCWMFLSNNFKHRNDLDDRWNGDVNRTIPNTTRK